MTTRRSGEKLLIAFVALGAAFLMARSFRHDDAPAGEPLREVADHVVLRETPAPGESELKRPEAPTAEIQPTLLAPPKEALEEPRTEVVLRPAPPPAMARKYADAPRRERYYGASGIRSPRRFAQRTHVVRDGDTLEALAERYLGDRARWRDIYRANRDKIDRPDLLPLAARLVIPARHAAPTSGQMGAVREASIARNPQRGRSP